jgi:hypothetical protein
LLCEACVLSRVKRGASGRRPQRRGPVAVRPRRRPPTPPRAPPLAPPPPHSASSPRRAAPAPSKPHNVDIVGVLFSSSQQKLFPFSRGRASLQKGPLSPQQSAPRLSSPLIAARVRSSCAAAPCPPPNQGSLILVSAPRHSSATGQREPEREERAKEPSSDEDVRGFPLPSRLPLLARARHTRARLPPQSGGARLRPRPRTYPRWTLEAPSGGRPARAKGLGRRWPPLPRRAHRRRRRRRRQQRQLGDH